MATAYVDRVQKITVSLTDRVRVRELLAGAPALTQLSAAAPAEIRSEVVALAETLGVLRSKLDGAGYDISKLSPEVVMSIHSPRVAEAIGRVGAWAQRSC